MKLGSEIGVKIHTMSGDHCSEVQEKMSKQTGATKVVSKPEEEEPKPVCCPPDGRCVSRSERSSRHAFESPKRGLKLSRNELLDSAEFNKSIASWFGEKGFIAMRSFFRASVLNSLQKNPKGVNESNCTPLDVVIVTLIADYLARNGKYFTMSVFSNEVLTPLVNANANVKQVLLHIGKCEDLSEPTLTQDTVRFVMETLNIRTHSVLGAGILHKYMEDRSGDLLSVLLCLLRDNACALSVNDRPVRDDDVVAAFSEGLQEEMGKLHSWFSNFNRQFVGVSGKVKRLIGSQAAGGKSSGGREDQELWDQMIRMDEHLKKQQDVLLKMREKERKKLSTYAKELEDLHQEMNLKLKSIQDYEKTLKIRERALRENEAMSVQCGIGDYGGIKSVSRRWIDAGLDKAGQCSGDQMEPFECKPFNVSMTGRIMEENLELKAILREQALRIETLTRKTALLSAGGETSAHAPSLGHGSRMTWEADRREFHPSIPPRLPTHRKPTSRGGSLLCAMSSSLRRSRMEIETLKDELSTTDMQYDRLLNNKLSKRL